MSVAAIDADRIRDAFARFQLLTTAGSGHPFSTFQDGLIAVWEGYKPLLRGYARGLLRPEDWSARDVGSGVILERTIAAIEIQDNRSNLTNNLVFWQNRFGHANRDHRVLLEARNTPKLRRDIEGVLYGIFRGGADVGDSFNRLRDLTDRKYPLLAYIFFLKDMDRFMPIQPTGFDRAFQALGIDFSTRGRCGWENYSTFNQMLAALQPLIAEAAGLKLANVRLIDAHSFCWVLQSLVRKEAEGRIVKLPGAKDDGRILGARETSIIEMRLSIENTVKNANGQLVQQTKKNKELEMTPAELEDYLKSLLDIQDNRCALTGIPFNYRGPEANKNLLPSADRIDSSGHYAVGNIQVVCRFINFWKGDTDNEEFRHLLTLVRGDETAE